jgi:hypothetical protein
MVEHCTKGRRSSLLGAASTNENEWKTRPSRDNNREDAFAKAANTFGTGENQSVAVAKAGNDYVQRILPAGGEKRAR